MNAKAKNLSSNKYLSFYRYTLSYVDLREFRKIDKIIQKESILNVYKKINS